MKIFVLCLFLILSTTICSAESVPEKPQEQEPTLYDHYHALKQMQESLAGRSLDDQARLQPQIQRAQRKACERLQKDHQERIPKEDYRRQGGDEFLVFSLELEQWCGTARQ
jgi:hypothetical protein